MTRVKSPPWHRVYPAQATRQKLLVYFCHVPAKQKPDKVSLFGRRSNAHNDEANELGKSIQKKSFPRSKKKKKHSSFAFQCWSRHQLPAGRTLKTSIIKSPTHGILIPSPANRPDINPPNPTI